MEKKKIIITILLCFLSIFTQAQLEPQCDSLLNQVYEGQCIQQSIDTLNINQVITSCVPFQPTGDGNIHFSFIIVNSNCGPNSPYNQLFLSIYNSTCDSLVGYDTIKAPDWDFFIHLNPLQSYILCYRWKARCQQYSWCPVINSSPLPVTYIWYYAKYSQEGRNINIAWSTGSEDNCNYYILEKLIDNYWRELQSLICSSNKNTINTYLITDERPLPKNIYRINQVDYNNKSTYTKPFEVLVNSTEVPCVFYNINGNLIDESKIGPGVWIKKCGESYTKVITIVKN